MGEFWGDKMVSLTEDQLRVAQDSLQQAYSAGARSDTLMSGIGEVCQSIHAQVADVSGGVHVLNSNMTSGFSGISSMMSSGFNDVSSRITNLNSSVLDVGRSLTGTMVQTSSAICGSIFISGLTTSAAIKNAIKRQTYELKNELMAIQKEEILSRNHISKLQRLNLSELKSLNFSIVRNHRETMWKFTQHSEYLSDVIALLQSPNKVKAKEIHDIGIFLLERGKFPEAQQALQDAKSAVYNSDCRINVSLAYLLVHLKRIDEALEEFNNAVITAPNNDFLAFVYMQNAHLHLSLGNYKLALGYSDKSRESAQKNVDILFEQSLVYLESNEIETAKILICEVLAIDTDYIKRYFDMSVCYDKNIIHFLLEEFEGCVDTNTEKIKNDLAEVEENISKLDVSKDNAKLSAALMSVKRIKDAMITFDNREREDARLKILELYNSLLRVEDDMEAQAVRIVQINEVKEQAFNILSALYKYAVHFKRGSTIEKEIDLYFEKMKSIIEINDNQEALDVFYKSLESFSSGFVEQINEFYVLQSAKIFKSKDNILNSTSRRMLDLIMCYFDYLEQMNLTQDDFLLNASVRRISS